MFKLCKGWKKDNNNPQNNNISNHTRNNGFSHIQPFKIVVIGDGAVGKTSLLVRYTTNIYRDDYQPTIFDNYSTLMNIDQQIYNISLWDTAGQEEYSSLRPLSYAQTDCFILCYSVTMPVSLENIQIKWLPELKEWAPNVPIVLAGLKCDVLNDTKIIESLAQKNMSPVTSEQGEEMAINIGAKGHILASALDNRNVNLLIETCIKSVYSDSQEMQSRSSKNPFTRIFSKITKK